MNKEALNLVMIPQEELYALRSTQKEILQQLKELRSVHAGSIPIKNITAIEFMKAEEFVGQSLMSWRAPTKSGSSKREEKSMCRSQKLTGILVILLFSKFPFQQSNQIEVIVKCDV